MKKPIVHLSLLPVLCFALPSIAFTKVLYTDGAPKGTEAFFIDGPHDTSHPNFNQTISEGFVATKSGKAVSLDFGEWVDHGFTPTSSVSWAIGRLPFASDIGSGSVTQVGFSPFMLNIFGGLYDLYESQVAITGKLKAGSTYYLTLGGAFDSGANPSQWDINQGPATCYFALAGVPQGICTPGFPAGAAFTINGNAAALEPSSFVLLAAGILGVAGVLRRN